MDIPEDLKYTKDHEWIKIDNSFGTIGITDFAQRELGDIVYFEIETVGQSLAIEDPFGTVEAVKTVADLYMPISGKVLEVNPDLEGSPESVNKNPYDAWIVKIEIENEEEINDLLDTNAYNELINA